MIAVRIRIIDTCQEQDVKSLVVCKVALPKHCYTIIIIQTVQILLLSLHHHSVNVGLLRGIKRIEVFICTFMIA